GERGAGRGLEMSGRAADSRLFKLPDVGEGLTEADIARWRVKPGDVITVNQVIVEIETAKSLVELPSPWAGTVAALLVEEGQTVDVGTPIIAIEVPDRSGGKAPAAPAKQAAAEPAKPTAAAPAPTAEAPSERQ